MNHINTDQKLQLVHTIRMQNQYNRMKCREREQLLYGSAPAGQRELYGAETAVGLPVQGEKPVSVKKSRMFTGFRLRFLIALILFSCFIYLDKNGGSLFEVNAFDIYAFLTESIELPETLRF